MQAATYIDEHKSVRTYRLEGIEKFGCSKELASRLKYAKSMVEKLVDKLDTKSSLSSGTVPLSFPTTVPTQS